MHLGEERNLVPWTTAHFCSLRRKVCNSSTNPISHSHPRPPISHHPHLLPLKKHVDRLLLLQKDASPLQHHLDKTVEPSPMLWQVLHCPRAIRLGDKGFLFASPRISSFDDDVDARTQPNAHIIPSSRTYLHIIGHYSTTLCLIYHCEVYAFRSTSFDTHRQHSRCPYIDTLSSPCMTHSMHCFDE